MLSSTRVLDSGKGSCSVFLSQPLITTRAAYQRSSRGRSVTFAAFGFFRKKIATAGAIDDLLAAIEDTQRGYKTTRPQRASIDAAVNVLQNAYERGSDFDSDLSATWKLLWTTEKETLFILRNAGLFRTTAGDVYQVIDSQNSSLQNVITFPPSGSFVVNSSIAITPEQRVNFQFKAASLNLPKRNIKLPPYGQGWFDTVFVNSKIRISRDSRGDTLIVAHDGPPRDVTLQS